MAQLRSLPLALLAGALLCTSALFSASNLIAQSFAPTVRIVDRIDESNLVTLKGNTHPAANAKNDRGRVSPTLPMTDLILVLSRSPEQQAAFDKFVASQYDSASPDFHQWLKPEQVGENFGPSETDIATLSNWLTGHGFSVDEVTKDRMSIRFSGTAAQVENAFHTEIHNLEVNGAKHIGNMTDPQIPAALAPAIVGVKALHNFFPRPAHHLGSQVTRDSETGKWKRLASAAPAGSAAGAASPGGKTLVAGKSAVARPQFGISVGGSTPYLVEDVGPWDFATIYDILPLWNNAGTPIDGTGQTIAIAGTSDIDVGQSSSSEVGANGNNDVAVFRNYFGLPTTNAANTPKRISGNSQPLTVCTDTTGTLPFPTNPCTTDDLTENSLDVEWSASIAKNAQIILVASYPASATDDNLYDSESYIVNNLTAPIMNVSYGECELGMGTAGNVEYYDLWEQAASEGIAVFVAAGDSGSASCDDGSYVAESGLAVSGLASTPWNTAVGGTDFNWCNPDTAFNTECTAAPYWSSTPITSPGSTQAVTTALGYVPETPWNETCTNPLTLLWVQDAANQIFGISSSDVKYTEQACNFIYQYSFYQDGFGDLGLGYYYPALEYLVSTTGGSGGASNCVVGSAVFNNTTGGMTGCSAGATSTGVTTNPDTGATQASIPLTNNGWPKPSWQTGVSGIPTDGVRDLPDVSFFASDGFVSSSAYLICVSEVATCTYSTNSEPFAQEVGGTSVATPAMAGVMALVNQKTGAAQGFANFELYKLAAKQTYSDCSAETVAANSTKCVFNDIDAGPSSLSTPYTNAMPCDALDISPNCTALYITLEYADSTGIGILTGYAGGTAYDLATGLGSLNVANVVNKWVSAIGTGATTITVMPSPNPVSESQPLTVTVTVASKPSGGTTPTGSVTLSGGGFTETETLNSSGVASFTIPAGDLSGGIVTLTANYTGDANYALNSGTGTVTVNKLTASVSATPSVVPPTTIPSNQSLVVTGTVACTGTCTNPPTPTGTVIVSYGTTYASQPATLSGGQYSVTISPNSLPGGTDVLNVVYSGDDNYATANTTTTVDVTFFVVLTPTMLITPASTTVDSGSPLTVTVTVSGTGATPTGEVSLTGSGYALTTVNLTGGIATFPIPANTLTSNPNFPLSDKLTADYEGDADYAQVVGSVTVTVTQSGYSLAATASTPASVTPGNPATSMVAVSSTTDYTGTVTFTSASCVPTSSPAGAVSLPGCSLTGSGTVMMTDGVATGSPVTYTVSTTGTTTQESALALPKFGAGDGRASARTLALVARPVAPAQRRNGSGWFETAGGAALAALFLFLVPGGSRKWRRMLSMLLLMASVTFAGVGCGGGGGSSTPPTLGTPTITVTPSKTSVAVNGSSFTVGVSVTGSSGTPTGGVTLSGGGYNSPAGSGTLSSGSTSFTINPSSFTTIGSVTLIATYGGDSNYNSGTGQASITVNNVPTTAGTYTFTVTPTSAPSFAAQPSTTFTVTVGN